MVDAARRAHDRTRIGDEVRLDHERNWAVRDDGIPRPCFDLYGSRHHSFLRTESAGFSGTEDRMNIDSYRFLDFGSRQVMKAWAARQEQGIIPFTPPAKPLSECTVALISTAGIARND